MALPDENKGRCYWLVYLLKLIPVLFIMAVIAWSYYAYVVELCIITISSMVKRILFLVMYHCLTFLFIWSYWRTIFTNIGIVPAKFKLPDSEYDSLVHAEDDSAQQTILQNCSRDLPNANYTLSGGVRYCDKCRSIKPDRSHHCSVCGVCILKMDHHCPWVNNCISFTNYKFFILFLAYGLIYCIYVTLTTMEYFIAFWKGHVVGSAKFHLLFLFFVALMFGVSLISLFSYHCHLVWCNRTTLEAFRPAVFQTGPDKNGFNLGACLNFKEVFGIDPKLWFIPVYTSLGDGITFPVQSRDQPSMYQSMDTTQNRSHIADDESLKLWYEEPSPSII